MTPQTRAIIELFRRLTGYLPRGHIKRLVFARRLRHNRYYHGKQGALSYIGFPTILGYLR